MAAVTVKAGEGNILNVLGMPLRFLCDAKDTAGAWSLMEEEIPLGHGPPPHRHDWDEAYYVIEGALICLATPSTVLRERPLPVHECSSLRCPLILPHSSTM